LATNKTKYNKLSLPPFYCFQVEGMIRNEFKQNIQSPN